MLKISCQLSSVELSLLRNHALVEDLARASWYVVYFFPSINLNADFWTHSMSFALPFVRQLVQSVHDCSACDLINFLWVKPKACTSMCFLFLVILTHSQIWHMNGQCCKRKTIFYLLLDTQHEKGQLQLCIFTISFSIQWFDLQSCRFDVCVHCENSSKS